MEEYLKRYEIELEVKGPVFIGSGREILKKEYIKLDREIIIPDTSKMYADLRKVGKAESFEAFLMDSGKKDLGRWLRDERIPKDKILDWKRYGMGLEDTVIEQGKTPQIMEFVKDPYGLPYIPGSSLKGMLRTVMLAWEINENRSDYNGIKTNMRDGLRDNRIKRQTLLQKEIKRTETRAFHTASRKPEKIDDMVNDIWAGIRISDSRPLKTEDLVLCQKLEYHRDGKMKPLNILRESLKPGTKVYFDMTVDTTICKYEKADIESAVSFFADMYYRHFISKYKGLNIPMPDTVWLGGGAGFITKTVVYPLFEGEGLGVTKDIMLKTVNNRQHRHELDAQLGVSPHIMKMTKCGGKIYSIGKCKLSIKEA